MMYGKYEIEAPTLVDALDMVFNASGIAAVEMGLPDNAEYLDYSLSANEEDIAEANPTLTNEDRDDIEIFLEEMRRAWSDE